MTDTSDLTEVTELAVRRGLNGRAEIAEAEVARLVEVGRDTLRRGEAVKVAEIVKAAAVSIDAFYRYFAGKDAFVTAIVEDDVRRIVAHAERRMADHLGSRGKIRAMVAAVLADLAAVGGFTRMHTLLATAPPVARGRQTLEDALARLLAVPALALGSQDVDRDTHAAAAVLLNRVERLAREEVAPTEADEDHVVAFVLRAVART
jgi:AcrR family transcriptional regulator